MWNIKCKIFNLWTALRTQLKYELGSALTLILVGLAINKLKSCDFVPTGGRHPPHPPLVGTKTQYFQCFDLFIALVLGNFYKNVVQHYDVKKAPFGANKNQGLLQSSSVSTGQYIPFFWLENPSKFKIFIKKNIRKTNV